jgi:hypothetical protein
LAEYDFAQVTISLAAARETPYRRATIYYRRRRFHPGHFTARSKII